MNELELSQMSDEEIMKRLRSGEMADALEKHPEFQILREASRRMRDRAMKQLVNVNPTDYKRMVQLQLMAQFYDNILVTMINNFKQEAEAVFEEAKAAGLVNLPPGAEEFGTAPR